MAAITRVGLTGAMTAYGTFGPKAAGAAVVIDPSSRYRSSFKMTDVYRVVILFLFGG